MKHLAHILLLVCLPFFAQAQTQDTIHISGTISSENGDYMLNVLILAHDSNGQELKNFFDFVDDDNRFNLSIPLSAHAAYLTVTSLCYHPDTIYLSNEPFQNYAITLRLLYPNCWDDVIVTSTCLNENPNIISSNNNLSSFDLTDFVQFNVQNMLKSSTRAGIESRALRVDFRGFSNQSRIIPVPIIYYVYYPVNLTIFT